MLRTSQKQLISEYNLQNHDLSDLLRRTSLRRAQAKNILRYRRKKRMDRILNWLLALVAMVGVGFVLGQVLLVNHLDVYHQPTQSWRDLQAGFFELIHKVCVYFNIQ